MFCAEGIELALLNAATFVTSIYGSFSDLKIFALIIYAFTTSYRLNGLIQKSDGVVKY
jgi:hypothetical protein